MPNLTRIASTVAVTGLLLGAPTAASAANAAESAPRTAQALAQCSSWASIGWNPGNYVYGGSTMSCSRPLPQLPRTVAVTLYRNGTAVEYGRHDCYGTGDPAVCTANSPAAANPAGVQTWCASATATYDSLYSKTSRECWNG